MHFINLTTMTFTDLYAVWEAEKRNTLRPMSYSTYAVLLERFILPRLGDNEAITEEDVDAFLRNPKAPRPAIERLMKSLGEQ